MDDILFKLTELEAKFRNETQDESRFQNIQFYIDYLNQPFIRDNSLAKIYYRQVPGDIISFFKDFSELDEALVIYSGINVSPSKQFNFHLGRPHSLNCFEGVWMYDGEADFILDGEIFHLQQGDFLMHAPGHQYEFTTQDDAIGINLMLRKNFILDRYGHLFKGSIAANKFFEAAIRNDPGLNYFILHAHPGQKDLNELICNIFMEYFSETSYHSDIIDRYFEIFIFTLMRASNSKMQSPHYINSTERYINEIKGFIENNYRTATLIDAADTVHLSKQYICRILKKHENKSFNRILLEVKVKKAMEYLLETDLIVECIAELTGFSSASHLSRVFKEIEGVPPTEFRKKRNA